MVRLSVVTIQQPSLLSDIYLLILPFHTQFSVDILLEREGKFDRKLHWYPKINNDVILFYGSKNLGTCIDYFKPIILIERRVNFVYR